MESKQNTLRMQWKWLEGESWTERWIWLLVPLACSVLPFGNALREGSIAGAGPDVISSTWAMWWFQQEWHSAAWGGGSILFNFPWGGSGSILSPITAIVWSVLDAAVGPAWATTMSNWFFVILYMLALAALGQTLKLSRLAQGCMALMFVFPRYPIFTIGETGMVGIAALPMIVGAIVLLKLRERANRRLWGVLMCMVALQGIENPYLAPVLPVSIMGVLLWERRWRWLWGWSLGILFLGLVVVLFRNSSGSYESVRATGYTELFGLHFPAIERVWARSSILDFFVPKAVLWPAGSMDSIHIQGREYLGITGLIGLISLSERRSWFWFVWAVIGLVFVTGSDWGGMPSPFGLLNSVAQVLVRPFTQPSRYFMLYVIGMSVCVGIVVHRFKRGSVLIWASLLVESLMLGGLSLRIPTTEIPSMDCVEWERMDAPTLIWPWDGADDQWYESSLQSRIFQMLHEQPGATIATGSWYLEGTVFPGHRLREIGWRKAMDGRGELDLQQLYEWGYRYAIVDERAGRVLSRIARDNIFDLDNRIMDCPNLDVYQIRP